MASNIVSGRYGAVNGVGSVFNWNLAQSKPPESVRNSATAAGTGRIAGIAEFTGSYQAAGGNPAAMPGDTIAFKGYVGPNSGTVGGVGTTYAVSALVASVAIVWDWASRKLIRHTVNFASNGGLTITPADTAIADVTTPVLDRIALLPSNDFIYGGTPTLIESKKTATLTITSDLQAYSNSDSGANKGRVAGPIDWNLSIDVERGDNALASDLYLDTLKLYVNATEFWLLDYALVGESTNIKVDMESGAIASQTINIAMSAFNAAGTIGSITKPGGLSAWWPFV